MSPHLAKNAGKPIRALEKRKRVMFLLLSAFLILASFVIFMTGVRINDNEVSKMVLITVFVAEGASKVIAQPITMLLIGGIWPFVAVTFFIGDVRFFLRYESRRAAQIRRFDARDPVPVDPNSAFELSSEWRQIEEHEAFTSGSQIRRGGRRAGIVLKGQIVGGATQVWGLFDALHRESVKTLAHLKDRNIVSKDFLANAGLTDLQVEAVWEILHGERTNQGITRKLMICSWFEALLRCCKIGGGPNSSSHKVTPILSANVITISFEDEEKSNYGSSDEEKMDETEVEDESVHENVASGSESDACSLKAVDEVEDSILKWLDAIKPSYGKRFAHIFAAHGCMSVAQMADFSNGQLESINEALKQIPGIKRSTRQRIRSALRSYFESIDGTETEIPAIEKDITEHNRNEVNSTPIEHWLDEIKPDYGERFAQIFKDHGCTTVREMASLGERELESINNTLKTLPGSKLATRRRIREALRSHFAAIDARPDDSKITDEEKEAAKKMAMFEHHETNKTEEIREPEESSSYNFTAQRKAAELEEDPLASSSSSEDEN